jgi:MinD-like ATPase involved in chromosome partitioning or flagellar assembly
MAGEISRESRLWETLQNFKKPYDYILIDCPPNLGILTINAVRASNEIIVPVEASRFSLEGLSQLTGIINLVRDRLTHDVKSNILVTNFDSRLRHSFKILDHIRATFSDRLFSTIVHVNVKLKEAQSEGTHVLGYDKYCRGAKDYFSLSREIILQETAPTAREKIEVKPKAKPKVDRMPELKEKMEEIIQQELPAMNEVVFTVAAPDAKEVYVAGDFNEWALNQKSRMEQDNGSWRKRIGLSEGKYRYRFVIDGKWVDDPANPVKEKNPFGEMDSLLEVSKQ